MLAAMGGRAFELTIDEVYCNGNKLYYTYSFTPTTTSSLPARQAQRV